ncbi:hypothetical protein SPRG_09023 [Saprolegnia parasitica CBS 223.65]|uniref:Uncharacterized protein n=1 Tax=Saprolegnia parasitica (strain CBS 223.65) TaxID=695850 RepID=A0A067C4P6_SAPPC|nr:hypothetical protein SPRG_09023 [Saprolegnia parasitica CBS 223.65]KDO25724.1 hypothetical protein SPRG_09023 [Saprolegnia parasitica CBS 223.65]|eukprot:XP_012203534.1 hypothetical protein SPRG_09023 [Saprolegnia parasitica CBS 223.65]
MDKAAFEHAYSRVLALAALSLAVPLCIPTQYLGYGAVATTDSDKMKRQLHRDSMHHSDYYGRHMHCYMMACVFATYASLSDAMWTRCVQTGVLLVVLGHAVCGVMHGFAQKRAAYQREQCLAMDAGQKSKPL